MQSLLHVLTIKELREESYPGSKLQIEKELGEKEGYKAFIASYYSEGLKIYGYLTIPNNPSGGLIIFCHGFVAQEEYQIDKQYTRYIDYLARAGYVVFKPDYRGYGESEGREEHLIESGNAIDVLNAISSLKYLNPQKIAIVAHSMGADAAMKAVLVNPEIKAVSLWSPVITDYAQGVKRWLSGEFKNDNNDPRRAGWIKTMESLYHEFGDPDENLAKYQAINPWEYLEEINNPLQLHYGQKDSKNFEERVLDLEKKLKELGKEVEVYSYPEGDHNLSKEVEEAMKYTIKFL